MPYREPPNGMTSPRTRRRLVSQLREKGISSEKVLSVISEVPRHFFVDEALARRAYDDDALPIGHSQTISQPYIVALMTSELIRDNRTRKVLEIGTGSGYQTAILSQLFDQVYTVERIASLYKSAISRLIKLNINNVRFLHGDGYQGWSEYQPYDGIIVTAAPEEVPYALLEQLAEGGKMVIPVGDTEQNLYVIRNTGDGYTERLMEPVRFVPLVPSRQ